MKFIKLKIKTKTREYPILIGSNLVINIPKIARKHLIDFQKCLLIIDSNISKNII